jgi:hypothetical protein
MLIMDTSPDRNFYCKILLPFSLIFMCPTVVPALNLSFLPVAAPSAGV